MLTTGEQADGRRRRRRRSEPIGGATVLITGGGSGIGRALGTVMSQHGARVVLADVDAASAHSAVAALNASPGAAAAVELDVTDRDAFSHVVSDLVRARGSIDYLINGAGVSIGGPTHELTGPHWDTVVDVNLGGVVNGVLAAYPHMVQAGGGHIVNIASGAGLVAMPFVVAYSATKHAVVGLSLGLRSEAAHHQVRVSVLCPGAVETPILDRLPPANLPPTPTSPVTPRAFLGALGQTPVDAHSFAHSALRSILRDRPVITVPRRLQAIWILQCLSPSTSQRLAGVLAARVRRDVLPFRESDHEG